MTAMVLSSWKETRLSVLYLYEPTHLPILCNAQESAYCLIHIKSNAIMLQLRLGAMSALWHSFTVLCKYSGGEYQTKERLPTEIACVPHPPCTHDCVTLQLNYCNLFYMWLLLKAGKLQVLPDTIVRVVDSFIGTYILFQSRKTLTGKYFLLSIKTLK